MTTQIGIRRPYSNSNREAIVHDTEVFSVEARMAAAMVEKWGLIAGLPDGEDSSGRQKLRIMTAKEVADHACNAATELMANFRARGWLAVGPDISELIGPEKDKD